MLRIHVALDPAADGPYNMSKDRELLSMGEEGQIACRVYSWDGPWVSLGRSQTAERDLLPTCPIPFVQRPTGGHAVLHGHDATIGLAVPRRIISDVNPHEVEVLTQNMEWLGINTGILCVQPPGSRIDHRRSVRVTYRTVTRPIIQALRECGLPAALAADTKFIRDRSDFADCFASVSETDIVHQQTGEKICGCALRLTRSAVLVQASIPIGRPLIDPASVFVNASPNVGAVWDSEPLAQHLQEALRYNFLNGSGRQTS